MAINKKLISFATQAQFDIKLNAGDIDNRSIVFIEDKKRIWTHGVFFDTSWDYVTGKPNSYTPSAHTLASHSDVTITSNSNGEILRWNGTNWINNTLAEAGIAAASHSHTLTGDVTGSGTTSIATTIANNLIPKTATSLGTTNLNDVLERGFYFQNANANATTARNYPINQAGSLVVTTSAGENQEYTTYGPNNRKFIRGRYSSSWGSWKEITGSVTSVALSTPTGLTVSGSPITTSGTLSISLQNGYSIPTTAKQGQWDTAYNWGNHSGQYVPLSTSRISTSINDIRSSGFYSLGNALNSPTGSYAYSPLIVAQSSSDRFVQLYLDSWGGSDNIYYRNGNGSVWGSWNTIYHSGNFANGTTAQYIRGDGSLATYKDTTYSTGTLAQLNAGTDTTGRLQTAKLLNDWINPKLDNKFDKTGGRLTTGTGDVSIELWRGTNASWNILNSGGYLRFQSNYTTVVGAYFDALKLDYNTGNALFKGNITAPTFIGALSGNASTATTATNLSRSVVAGNGLTGGGALSANRTLTLGTPSTLTAASTNAVTDTSHTHAITTTNTGAASTIVQTNGNGAIGASRYGFYGVYNSAQTQSIWSMGSQYGMNATTTSLGNLYGLAYSYISVGGSSVASKHQIHFVSNGTARVSVNLSDATVKATTFIGALSGNAASATKVNNKLTLKFDTGTTENTNLYTYDGSAAKTINITAGSNVSLTKAANTITISSTNTTYTTGTLMQLNVGTDTTGRLQTAKSLNDWLANKFQVVTTLPTSPAAGVFYFVKE